MTTIRTVTSPAVLQNSAGVTEGQWDMRAQTRYQLVCLRSRDVLSTENKPTLCTKLSLSALNAESVCSSKVSKDYQTDIRVSDKYIVSAGEGFRMGKVWRERHLTFPALQRML